MTEGFCMPKALAGKEVSLRPGSASVAPGQLRLARCSPLSRPVAAHRTSVRAAPVSAAPPHPLAAPFLSATCRWPAACPIILPPLALRQNNQGRAAGRGPAISFVDLPPGPTAGHMAVGGGRWIPSAALPRLTGLKASGISNRRR